LILSSFHVGTAFKKEVDMQETGMPTNTPILVDELRNLIESSRAFVAQTVNSTLTMLYWKIGLRINQDILQHQRAGYGKQVIATIAKDLETNYGTGFSEKSLRRMVQFADAFPDEQIVASAMRQLSWTHFTLLLPVKDPLEREFYAEMCRIEKWSVKTLRGKIGGMLFERTAISKRPEELIKKELEGLRLNDQLSPELVFQDPYFLGFLGLKDTYSEKNLEDAILRHLERFILELGQGFSFVARQLRMIIDGEDFWLDLLFYHRKLKRLVAVDLKLGKFKAAFKSQMELYLRWLEKYEMQEGEATPIGLILCTEGGEEQIELLQLHEAGIKVAKYMTELPSLDLLQEHLRKAVELSREKHARKAAAG
jgi:predicted nuclease of restriction endonuclease-like (RecB) superfamily